jgi:GT2 family glycosyltransferase
VLVANYNGMAVIDDCLQSVLVQEGDLPVEIIVHDDASTDGSAGYIRQKYPVVTLIESEQNVGFCVANNRMAARAKGEYLLLLNNDAALFPDALETLYAEAVRLGRPAILGLPQYDAETGELLDIGSLLDPFLNPIPNRDPRRCEVGMVIGACLWISNTLWDEIGGFPTWFGSVGEDLYLCCRARLEGHAVRVVPKAGYSHHVGHSFGGGKIDEKGRLTTTLARRALSERNKTYTMALIYPAPLLQWLFPLHLFLLLAEGLTLAIVKLNWALFYRIYWSVFIAIISEKNRLCNLRRKVQKKRVLGISQFLSIFRPLPQKLRLFAKHGIPQIYR